VLLLCLFVFFVCFVFFVLVVALVPPPFETLAARRQLVTSAVVS
jgi:hypothetical protein